MYSLRADQTCLLCWDVCVITSAIKLSAQWCYTLQHSNERLTDMSCVSNCHCCAAICNTIRWQYADWLSQLNSLIYSVIADIQLKRSYCRGIAEGHKHISNCPCLLWLERTRPMRRRVQGHTRLKPFDVSPGAQGVHTQSLGGIEGHDACRY